MSKEMMEIDGHSMLYVLSHYFRTNSHSKQEEITKKIQMKFYLALVAWIHGGLTSTLNLPGTMLTIICAKVRSIIRPPCDLRALDSCKLEITWVWITHTILSLE